MGQPPRPGPLRDRRARGGRPLRHPAAGPRLMDVLRTPDERFADLPGYPFAPHHTDVPASDGSATLRIHHVDEGLADAAETILLMHGEPSWSRIVSAHPSVVVQQP